MKPLVIKSANRYLIYNAEGVEVGHIYYPSGSENRQDLDDIINELFEVREQ